MSDTALVIPYDVEGALLDVLKGWHVRFLAKAERLRGEQPKTFQAFTTMVRMSDAQATRLSGDTVPALLLGVIGAPEFVRNEEDGIDAVYQLGMQVTVMGTRRRDVILRRDVMAWTVAECMYQAVPRRGLINSVQLTDYEPISATETQRTVGDARMVWEVGVPNVLSVKGYLPAADSGWPLPDDPYEPVPDWPQAIPTFTVEKESVVT